MRQTEIRFKPFKCELDSCGKAFTKSNNLKQHYRVHSGGPSIFLQICEYDFKIMYKIWNIYSVLAAKIIIK